MREFLFKLFFKKEYLQSEEYRLQLWNYMWKKPLLEIELDRKRLDLARKVAKQMYYGDSI